MFALLITVFGIACVLHSGNACHYCTPPEGAYTLSEAYCNPSDHTFLIQGEVMEETGPLLYPGRLEHLKTEGEKEQYMATFGFMRYTMAVREVYRNNNSNIQQTIAIDAKLNTTMCGTRLKMGKTYVLSGYYFTVDGSWVTDACEYIREFDTEVEVVLPVCPDI